MDSRLIEVNLIRDRSILTTLNAHFGSIGSVLICNGCCDLEASIVALLVIEETQEAWPLCGECLRQLSPIGQIV